jgi:hypothetical protein
MGSLPVNLAIFNKKKAAKEMPQNFTDIQWLQYPL